MLTKKLNPRYWFIGLLWVCILCSLVPTARALWTEFDLVRPKNGSWGSEWSTSWTKISATDGNGPVTVGNYSRFGWSMVNIGDLNGDGVDDLAVGAPREDSIYIIPNPSGSGTKQDIQKRTGAVYILFMNGRGVCDFTVRISGEVSGGPKLYKDEEFGFSVGNIGDLDGDGIQDLVIGAPGQLISSVYILYMKTDGTVKSHSLIRGNYVGTIPAQIVNGTVPMGAYIPNGPQLKFLCRFGQTVLGIGDWDGDGVRDIAAVTNSVDGGNGLVYFLYMFPNGTVKHYTSFGTDANGNNVGGAPIFKDRTFVGFGASLLLMPDMDKDGIPELAIGVNNFDDADTTHYASGVVFICFMAKDATIKRYTRISELQEQYNVGSFGERKKNTWHPGGRLPLIQGDRCGTALATIGDINQDHMRQQRPTLRSPDADNPDKYPDRQSIDDLIIGCPQTDTGDQSGRIFLIFLSHLATMRSFTLLPGETDVARNIAPVLGPTDHFGYSLAGIQDLDKNGLREFAIGAPGTRGIGPETGAIYIFFLRRRRWHSFWTDNRAYWAAIIVPPSVVVFGICVSIAYFCWTFRRKPDEIELLVLKSGVTIEKKRKRTKKEKKKEEAKVYVDDADDF
jgi:hypothetical protein